ncbi:MAG: hypothetical protein HYY13_08590 [Nitrospirae bacterium]|nr:hypothetical protein [Nitrospirota bacterium]
MLILNGQIEGPEILVDHARCDLCANCVRTCPMGVLKIVERRVVRREVVCIGCRNCKVSCGQRAIEVVGQHRILSAARQIGYVPLKDYPPYEGLAPAKAKLAEAKG